VTSQGRVNSAKTGRIGPKSVPELKSQARRAKLNSCSERREGVARIRFSNKPKEH
jgi:hypothetical protein